MAKKKKGGPDLPNMEGPGVGTVKIAAIDAAAAEYVTIRDRRMSLTEKEVEAKERVIDLMHKNEAKIGRAPDGSMKYRYEDTLVELMPEGEKLRVKAYKDPGEPE